MDRRKKKGVRIGIAKRLVSSLDGPAPQIGALNASNVGDGRRLNLSPHRERRRKALHWSNARPLTAKMLGKW
jgi:hypothetical protein